MSALELTLIGIGTGNPEHLTLQAIRAMNAQDLILIPQRARARMIWRGCGGASATRC